MGSKYQPMRCAIDDEGGRVSCDGSSMFYFCAGLADLGVYDFDYLSVVDDLGSCLVR